MKPKVKDTPINEDKNIKLNMSFEEAMKKALNTPLPKKTKKATKR